jgi:serine/threonine protein kinase
LIILILTWFLVWHKRKQLREKVPVEQHAPAQPEADLQLERDLPQQEQLEREERDRAAELVQRERVQHHSREQLQHEAVVLEHPERDQPDHYEAELTQREHQQQSELKREQPEKDQQHERALQNHLDAQNELLTQAQDLDHQMQQQRVAFQNDHSVHQRERELEREREKELRNQLQNERDDLVQQRDRLQALVEQREVAFQNERDTLLAQINALQSNRELEQSINALVKVESKLFKLQFEIQPLCTAELEDFKGSQLLGSASFGVVHKVQTNWAILKQRIDIPNPELCTPWNEVAIKMLYNFKQSHQPANTLILKRRFDQEYQFPITHPHWSIVRVFNYFRAPFIDTFLPPDSNVGLELYDDRTVYFTMELGRGTLQDYLKDNPIQELKSGLVIVLQLLIGVAHLETCGYSHLDLKLDNIIYLNKSRPKIRGNQFVLADFGTSKHSPVTLRPGDDGLLGNQINRSPEVLRLDGAPDDRGRPVVDVSKNDVWSVGCMMFEIFEKSHPFYDSRDQDGLRLRITDRTLPRLNENTWGGACNRLLELMWKRNPQERISGREASRMCAMILWDFPFHEKLELSLCRTWLNQRLQALHARLLNNQNLDRFLESFEWIDIDDFLEMELMLNTSPEEVYQCAARFLQ